MSRSILDPAFRYVPAVETDLRKTFARVRKEQRDADRARAELEAATAATVRPLTPKKARP